MEYLYTVWFRNILLEPHDEDYEWPACIIIEAQSENEATEWGDYLSKKYCRNIETEKFLRSGSEIIRDSTEEGLLTVPRIKYGYEATDDEIGW